MAEPSKPGNGTAAAPPQLQVRVVGQYIKDLSFENPNVAKLAEGAPQDPQLKLEINVEPNKVGADLYESALIFKAEASAKIGTIYQVELVYAGLFKIENAPAGALEPLLHVNCPALLFPFLRRLIADLTREGGFPPLLLDPVDFGSLLMQKRQAMAGAGGVAGGSPGTMKA